MLNTMQMNSKYCKKYCKMDETTKMKTFRCEIVKKKLVLNAFAIWATNTNKSAPTHGTDITIHLLSKSSKILDACKPFIVIILYK